MLQWRCVALALVAACSGAPAPAKAPPRPLAPTIHVTHVRADRFRVDYTFPEPTPSLTFVLPSPVIRAHWRAASDDMRLVRADGVDSLIAPEPRTAWAIELDVDDMQPEKDYRTFYRLTDRGLLLYTGHLAAVPTNAPPKEPMRLVLTAAGDESVVVHGAPRGHEATTIALPGTYAYFGTLQPVETADFVGLIDRGFPPALRARLDALVPPLFALFGDALGRPAAAAEKPLFLASFHTLSYAGRDLGGGVMRPRVVNFDIGLPPAAHEDAETGADIEHIVAHEIAHLWNADLYSTRDDASTAWLREGSAEALALRALRRLGRLDDDAYRERLSTAVSLCALALAEGQPLSASTRRGHPRDFYECGSTIALLTEAAVHRELFSFYREVFAGPGEHYDAARYFATLEARGDQATADLVRRLADERLSDPTTEIIAALRRVGVETAPVHELPRAYEAQAGAAAFRALVAPSCLSSLDLRGNYGVVAVVTVDGACGEAARGDELATFAGVDIAQKGASAFDAAHAQCSSSKSIEVGRKGKPKTHIPCVDAPRSRPPYFRVTKAP